MNIFNKNAFKLHNPFQPSGDQPKAIQTLNDNRPGKSVLLGVTGSGKTFTLANVIAQQNKPVLIMSPNKTLAAQLYEEFSLFFPENKVCYFVSYYDYYQPESYLPAQDVYIPKETKVNTEIERLRVEATASIINRNDVIIIASVSAIYSLGNPWDYRELTMQIKVEDKISRRDLIDKLIFIQYKRNDFENAYGNFKVLGNTITVNLPYMRNNLRIEMFGDEVERLEFIDRQEQKVLSVLDNVLVFPAKHFLTTKEKRDSAIEQIKRDLEREAPLIENPLYRERLLTRVKHDIEMLEETGYCTGIENYSRYFDGRRTGDAPYALFDFFDKDFLLIIDESHIAIPQLHGMYKGDRARKQSLVDFGFRLSSSYDNRPLKFEEIEKYFKDVIFVSATPSDYEVKSADSIAEQIVRPTGIIDPEIEIVKREGQLEHLIGQIKNTTANGFRTLVTVLTKKAAEELAQYLENKKIKVCYMHSEIKTPERTELIHKLRSGVFDCLVGINLLREGLDIPEVALVAIIDADIEGFLRNTRSLVQTIGRAARNTESKVIFYADKITQSMQLAIAETNRRRQLQIEYNTEHGITPKTVSREVGKSISKLQERIMQASKGAKQKYLEKFKPKTVEEAELLIQELEQQMQLAAENLEFEKAIEIRDKILELKKAIK
ncbi:MAG: UvrABC system protein B [candidate division TM6 bacterium GW2011_GWF2_37_49]|nr:MAG: UvrABC system protein B [candidate division TM6 bacterium GW2011_GWF2_37_49]